HFKSLPDTGLLGVCDVDARHLNAAAQTAGPGVLKTMDYREILDRKDIDAVVISTPDHWHAIPALRAMEAGKDVYVEKPLGHNIAEGRAIVAAAEAGKRIVQIGLQQRSGPHFIEAVRRIRAGELGKVSCVHAWNAWSTTGMGGDLGNPPDEARAPEGIDYDRWLGPAPLRPFNPRRLHFSFYFWWDYAGGMVSDWGVHLFDIVLWALGSDILSVAATGGRHVFKDCRETPDTVDAVFECPDYIMAYSMRHGSGFPYHGAMDHGIMFFGTKAMLRIDRASFEIFPEGAREPALTVKDQGQDQHHKLDFLAAVRSRKKPAADALCGHLAAIPGHLANISLRVGRKLVWDPKTETIAGDREASALLAREYRAPYTL
ncbi:MAG: Gfo/Idh/MocA family oxidoreductase, partial [Planctomycetes bacterium]|nr:Gfo/Idh/MocA family oxidoreductase [Planctomycetota bacterium]